MGYEGWENYETWAVALWFNNNERLYKLSKTFKSPKEIEDYVEKKNPLANQNNLYSDFIRDALNAVNYEEIFEDFQAE